MAFILTLGCLFLIYIYNLCQLVGPSLKFEWNRLVSPRFEWTLKFERSPRFEGITLRLPRIECFTYFWGWSSTCLPTLSLFYSYFLSGNKYRKNITCENMGQFQFCINLLPLELIWRSASCPRHWNQRWFGDAAFTIPSGKQWDHMSPWPPSWLSAGIEECCRSANESGHQWLKNKWLETIWH